MKINKITQAFAAILVGACSPDQGCSSWEDNSVVYVLVDDPEKNFSPEELIIIDEALIEWSEAVNNHVTFVYVFSKETKSLIIIRPDSLQNINDERDLSAVTDWVTWERGGAVTVPYDIDERNFKALLLHEVGHALGLAHDDSDTIMYKEKYRTVFNVTCKDVEQFCEVNSCEAEEMEICINEQ